MNSCEKGFVVNHRLCREHTDLLVKKFKTDNRESLKKEDNVNLSYIHVHVTQFWGTDEVTSFGPIQALPDFDYRPFRTTANTSHMNRLLCNCLELTMSFWPWTQKIQVPCSDLVNTNTWTNHKANGPFANTMRAYVVCNQLKCRCRTCLHIYRTKHTKRYLL